MQSFPHLARLTMAFLVGLALSASSIDATARVVHRPSLYDAVRGRPERPSGSDTGRPVIAVVASNGGTETTDFFIPYGMLKSADVADVFALSTAPGPVQFMPALKAELSGTIAGFEASHPDGADYVIVPALHDPNDPRILAFIRAQAAKGAVIVGICSGAKVLSAAGLLRDRAATGHWMDIAALQNANPSMQWTPDRRYVSDRGVMTTTGVTASIPASIALVEQIAGHGAALRLATMYGVDSWGVEHDSSAFALRPHLGTIALNYLAFWRFETLALPVVDGVDDVALALTADAYSRTYRSRVRATSPMNRIVTRSGVMLVTEDPAHWRGSSRTLPTPSSVDPVHALDAALDGISHAYGPATMRWVAAQIEYQIPAPDAQPGSVR